MAQREIVWTRTADLQFASILEYWANRNKSSIYSKKLIGLVSRRTKQISLEPFSYQLTDIKDIRIASLEVFSIFYRVTDTQIIIVAFWDNRQDPEKLFDVLKS